MTVSPTATCSIAAPIACTQPGILMAKGIGQLDMDFSFPLTLDDMEVGPAEPGAPPMRTITSSAR